MSGKLISAVYELDLIHSHQNIAVALAHHGNDDGSSIYPGNEYLAWKTGYTERNIIRLLGELEAMGLIVPVNGQSIGRGHRQQYIMDVSAVPRKAPFQRGTQPLKGEKPAQEKVKSQTLKGEISDTEKVKSQPIKGEKSDTRHIEYPRVEHPLEQSYEQSVRENARETEAVNSSPSLATATLRSETPQAVTVQSRNPRPPSELVNMGDPNDPRFTTPYYGAVARACLLREKPLDVSHQMRGQIAYYAAEFQRLNYSLEQIATAGANWRMESPPSPRQLFDKMDSLLVGGKARKSGLDSMTPEQRARLSALMNCEETLRADGRIP